MMRGVRMHWFVVIHDKVVESKVRSIHVLGREKADPQDPLFDGEKRSSGVGPVKRSSAVKLAAERARGFASALQIPIGLP